MAYPTGGTTHVKGSTPYAWPWDGDTGAAGTAVLVIHPRGPWPTRGSLEAFADAASRVCRAVHDAGGAVLFVSTAPPSARSTPEVAAHDAAPAFAGRMVVAAGVDGFYGSSLDATLRERGIRRLLLVGRGLETSIHSTMRTANDQGYECLLVADACVPYDPNLVQSSLSQIEKSGGIFGAVGTADAVVAAFTQRSSS